jgi:hypothetical protein
VVKRKRDPFVRKAAVLPKLKMVSMPLVFVGFIQAEMVKAAGIGLPVAVAAIWVLLAM